MVHSSGSRIPIYLVYRSIQPGACTRSDRLTYPPLALGIMAAYAISFPEIAERFHLVPAVVTSEEIAGDLIAKHGSGVFLVSNYMWSMRDTQVAVGRARWCTTPFASSGSSCRRSSFPRPRPPPTPRSASPSRLDSLRWATEIAPGHDRVHSAHP
jgi:hypothetical protein